MLHVLFTVCVNKTIEIILRKIDVFLGEFQMNKMKSSRNKNSCVGASRHSRNEKSRKKELEKDKNTSKTFAKYFPFKIILT